MEFRNQGLLSIRYPFCPFATSPLRILLVKEATANPLPLVATFDKYSPSLLSLSFLRLQLTWVWRACSTTRSRGCRTSTPWSSPFGTEHRNSCWAPSTTPRPSVCVCVCVRRLCVSVQGVGVADAVLANAHSVLAGSPILSICCVPLVFRSPSLDERVAAGPWGVGGWKGKAIRRIRASDGKSGLTPRNPPPRSLCSPRRHVGDRLHLCGAHHDQAGLPRAAGRDDAQGQESVPEGPVQQDLQRPRRPYR